ncbi:hypothetical protein D3H34_27800 [Acidovorax cavernicola]|uniref:Lipoprotein n=1 Tax=Acidovorax cavernicola TaxID=1675792 RepID=A0A9X8CZX0_9BURK|nr:hypothetical protein D3H34_27800 [Acidovorax cavernicola]
MIRIHHLAGVLAALGLSGCIVLPPPLFPPGPPPGFRGEGPPPPPRCEARPGCVRPAFPEPR